METGWPELKIILSIILLLIGCFGFFIYEDIGI